MSTVVSVPHFPLVRCSLAAAADAATEASKLFQTGSRLFREEDLLQQQPWTTPTAAAAAAQVSRKTLDGIPNNLLSKHLLAKYAVSKRIRI